jgi:hypothetical protein
MQSPQSSISFGVWAVGLVNIDDVIVFQFIFSIYLQPSNSLFYIKKINYSHITLKCLFSLSSPCTKYCTYNFTVQYY